MDYNSGLIGAKEEGRDEGKREATKENARRIKADGLDVAHIAKCTDLSVEEIEVLV